MVTKPNAFLAKYPVLKKKRSQRQGIFKYALGVKYIRGYNLFQILS